MPSEYEPSLTPAPVPAAVPVVNAAEYAHAAIVLGGIPQMDPAAARIELDRIHKDPTHPYWVRDKDRAAHDRAVKDVRAMVERLGAHDQATRAAQRAAQPAPPPRRAATMTEVATARAQLARINSDPAHPALDRNHPHHARALAAYRDLVWFADAPRRARDREPLDLTPKRRGI